MGKIENKDRMFLVKRKGRVGFVVTEDEFIGLEPDPFEHAKYVALEMFFEDCDKENKPVPQFTERGRVIHIEAQA